MIFYSFFCFKSMKEMNLNESLDPKVVKINIAKEGPCFFDRGPLTHFYLFIFFHVFLTFSFSSITPSSDNSEDHHHR